ncbi:MAG: S8 family serine peptidase [Dehalococcoidales bacterium]|nr:S8 family serine peptidase [Dehalococcoidales bacterium]
MVINISVMNRLAILLSIFLIESILFFSQSAVQAISGSEEQLKGVFSAPSFSSAPAGGDKLPGSIQVNGLFPGSVFYTDGLNRITPNDAHYSKQWALDLPGLDFSNVDRVTPAREVIVAVLDTGIDSSHEDLKDRVIAEKNFFPDALSGDSNGHGTHIAGIIAAQANNGVGIAGIAPFSRLLDVKVADDRGCSHSQLIAEGIIWAVDHGAGVINISITISGPGPELEEAVDYAWRKGAVIVAAVSNQTAGPVYPADCENGIAVAAIDQDYLVGPIHYDEERVDIAAPGFSIFSTLPNNSYGYKSGTSMAAAQVSGLAAILYSMAVDNNENGLINDEVRSSIETTSTYDAETGIKIIDPAQAIAAITAR